MMQCGQVPPECPEFGFGRSARERGDGRGIDDDDDDDDDDDRRGSVIVVVRASGDDPIAPSGGKDDDDDDGGIDDAPPAVEKDATMDDSDGSTGKRGESLRRSRARGTDQHPTS